jgi:predicted regulator of Ras-like GTPase activity (Roadblock/LC7/MglB family)
MSTPESTTATSRDLHWLLDKVLSKTPGAREALVLSRDGLKMCFTPGLGEDKADQLSAIAAGIQSLSLSASAEFGDRVGAGQAMVEFGGGVLLVVPAAEGAHLAVLAEEDADVGMVGHRMNELVEQIGDYLAAQPRQAGYDRAPGS